MSGSNIYLSNNYGVSWNLVNDGDGYANEACINDSGSVLIAVGWGGMFISTNYGGSWAVTSNTRYPNDPQGVCCSALGDIIYVAVLDDCILHSVDYGANWTILAQNIGDFDIARNYITCSDDDSIVLVANQATGLKSSTGGGSWTAELPTMFDVSSNSSGGTIICGQIDGYVYVSAAVGYEFYSNHVVLHLAEAKCLKVLGYPLFDNVRIHRYINPTQGGSPNIITIDNATLVSADIAADVLAKTAEFYNLRYQQDVTLFPDAAIKPSDIETVSSLYGKRVDGITKRLEGDLTGGYLNAAEFIGRERTAS